MHLFGGAPATGGDGGCYGFGAEKTLDVEEGAGGSVVEGAVATPEAELSTLVGQNLFRSQPQKGEAGGGRVRIRI